MMDILVSDNESIKKYNNILNEWFSDIFYSTLDEWNKIIPNFKDKQTCKPKTLDDIILENKSVVHYIGLIDGKLVGYLSVVLYKDVSYITCLYINKDYRNKGYGYKLLDYVLSIMLNNGSVCLDVSAINDKALNLYKKFGFQTFNLELGLNKKI